MKYGEQVTAKLHGRVKQVKIRILVNSTLSQTRFHIYRQQTNLQEGSVFTGVYLYTGGGGGWLSLVPGPLMGMSRGWVCLGG